MEAKVAYKLFQAHLKTKSLHMLPIDILADAKAHCVDMAASWSASVAAIDSLLKQGKLPLKDGK